MVYNDGTQFGGSEPQGTGVTILLNAVYGNPATRYTADLPPIVVVFTPDLSPIGS